MTRKDFFKSAIGALSLFGLAKVLKPKEQYTYGKEFFHKTFKVWVRQRKDLDGRQYLSWAKEAEVWTDWKRSDLCIAELKQKFGYLSYNPITKSVERLYK